MALIYINSKIDETLSNLNAICEFLHLLLSQRLRIDRKKDGKKDDLIEMA